MTSPDCQLECSTTELWENRVVSESLCVCLACCHIYALRDASPVTPPTKMTSLTTRFSHSSVVEQSNWQSGEVMGSIPVGD